MKKRLMLVCLVVVLLLAVLTPAVLAEEATDDGWNYDSENNVLVLKNYQGPVKQSFAGQLLVVVEGDVVLEGTLESDNLLLVVLTDASLTIKNETGGCLESQDLLLMTGAESTVSISSGSETAAAVTTAKMFAAGPGTVSVKAEGVGIEAETVVLQQSGVVEVQGNKQALDGELIRPASHSAFLDEASNTPGTYESGTYLQVREHLAADVTEEEIGMTAPNASAITEQAMMACYDDQGKLLAVVPGTRDGDRWSFENPGVDGTWKAFFLDDSYAPETESVSVPMTGTAQTMALASEEPVALQSVGGDYELAIEVMQYFGIMPGYEVAEDVIEFKPEGSVSREEAAMIVSILANAGSLVSDSYADACTVLDVQKTRWSASYVGYCQETGIVSHMIKNNTFDPVGKIKKLDFAVMLLSVLGYDSRAMGYCDRNWIPKARQDAWNIGLFDGIGDINNDPITRGEAAQLIWNALQADVVVGVMSLEGTARTLPRDAATFLKSIVLPGSNLIDATKSFRFRLDRDCRPVLISDMPLMEALYQLRLEIGDMDEWGRPGSMYKLINKNDAIVFYHEQPDQPYAIYTTEQNLSAALNAQVADGGYVVSLYHNGTTKYEKEALDTSLLGKIQSYMGNGVCTEIYVNEKTKTVTVVVIELHVAQIDLVNIAENMVTLVDPNGSMMEPVSNTDGWKEGQWLQYHKCGTRIQIAGEANVISGTVTRLVNEPEQLVMDGVTYRYSKALTDHAVLSAEKVSVKDLGQEIQIITDLYGYVQRVIRPKPETTTMLFMGGSAVKTMDGIVDGEQKYTLTAKQLPFENAPASEAVTIDEALYKALCATDDDLLITVEQADPLALVSVAQQDTATVKSSTVSMENTTLYLTDETQILVRVLNTLTGKYEYGYYDGYAALDVQISNCPCQYVADGKNLTHMYFDLASAKPDTVAGLALALTYSYDEAFNQNGMMVEQTVYEGVFRGEKVYLAFADLMVEESTAWKAEWVKQGTSHDGCAIYAPAADCKPKMVEKQKMEIMDGMLINSDTRMVEFSDEASCVLVVEDFGSYSFMMLDPAELGMYLEMHGYSPAGWLMDEDGDGRMDDVIIFVSSSF